MSETLRLYCDGCDMEDCYFRAYYVPTGSKEGCLRELDDDVYIRYYHFNEEVWPFHSNGRGSYSKDEQFPNYIQFLEDEVAYAPLLHKYNIYGKPEIADTNQPLPSKE